MLDSSDMGLQLLQYFWSPFVKIEITLVGFTISGKVTNEKDKLTSLDWFR